MAQMIPLMLTLHSYYYYYNSCIIFIIIAINSTLLIPMFLNVFIHPPACVLSVSPYKGIMSTFNQIRGI